jgi:hypothetical protein
MPAIFFGDESLACDALLARDMATRGRFGESFRPATLGSTLAAGLVLIVWCKDCRHQVEPDVAEQVERYGAGLTLLEWAARLRCGKCGSREVDFVVSGGRR